MKFADVGGNDSTLKVIKILYMLVKFKKKFSQ